MDEELDPPSGGGLRSGGLAPADVSQVVPFSAVSENPSFTTFHPKDGVTDFQRFPLFISIAFQQLTQRPISFFM